MAQEGSDEAVEPPRRWVEAFIESEQEVRGVLDDVKEAHLLGEYETVRERLRAMSRAEDGVFRVVTFAVLDVDVFYADLADQYEGTEPPVDALQSLGADYGRLADALELVFTERANELRNPMPTLRRGFRYSESLSLPRLDYELYSGEVELCEFVHPPSQALALARSIVASTAELLDVVEDNDDDVAQVERERIALVADGLADELGAVTAHVDEVRDPTGDGADATDDVDTYEDWSFY